MSWSQHFSLELFPGRFPPMSRSGPSIVAAGLLGVVVMAGCVKERVIYDSWATLEELADQSTPRTGERRQRAADRKRQKQWAVLVASLDGSGHRKAAADMVTRLRREARLTDIWVRELEKQTMIYKGGYTAPRDRAALNAQRQVRMIKIEGGRPFAAAQLVPIVAGANIVTDPFDLQQYTGYYSLQIEVYDNEVESHRDIAEQRAQTLRDKGSNAFYYHGPHRSMVTLGLLARDKAFVQEGTIDVYSPSVRDLQARHPRNLHNGHTVIEKENGRRVREQPSFLVYIR